MMRPTLPTNFSLVEDFGAAGGVAVASEAGGDVESGILATGGSGGSTTSLVSMGGTTGAASGGFAATAFVNMSPGMIGNMLYGRSAF